MSNTSERYGLGLARTASLVGDPARANMLATLMDGRALTATELAGVAGVTPATASGHLAKLVDGHLLARAHQGRHRYYRLAGPDVARMLEGLLVLGDGPRHWPSPRIGAAMREARTCYDHLAGRLAVSLADALTAKDAINLSEEGGAVTASGVELFARFGIAMPERNRRPFCRPCLDWSERRPHLAGVLGAALCMRCEELGWIERVRDSRAVTVTPAGRLGFSNWFGVEA